VQKRIYKKSYRKTPIAMQMLIWPEYSWQVAPQQSLLPLDPAGQN
jgi:hypothetical protein